ncbi:MAG: DNA gyrase inhibitor YacG [Thermogutta sp.]
MEQPTDAWAIGKGAAVERCGRKPVPAETGPPSGFPLMHKQAMADTGEVRKFRCPICGKQFSPPQSSALPFCSERCRTIDLYRWLKEEYTLPLPPRPDEEDDSPREDARPGWEA